MLGKGRKSGRSTSFEGFNVSDLFRSASRTGRFFAPRKVRVRLILCGDKKFAGKCISDLNKTNGDGVTE